MFARSFLSQTPLQLRWPESAVRVTEEHGGDYVLAKRVVAVTSHAVYDDNKSSSALETSRVKSLVGILASLVHTTLNLVLQASQNFCELPEIILINYFSLSIRKNWFPLTSFKNSN